MMKLCKALLLSLLLISPARAASEKWIAGSGVGLTWTDICGAEVKTTSLADTNAVACSVVVANGTALDLYAMFSISLASMTTGGGSPNFQIFMYPLNLDGTTYGDGKYGSAAVGPPPSNYAACAISVPPSVTAAIVGSCGPVLIIPGSFKIVLYNNSLGNTASSGNLVQYKTFNRQVN